MAKASSRSPHGERGLKLGIAVRLVPGQWSLPAWGAWIEIDKPFMKALSDLVAPRMGSVD